MKKNMRVIQKRHEETAAIFRQLSILRKKKDLCEADFVKLVELREALLEIAPAHRYVWVNGKPEIDLYRELLILEKEI